MDLNYLKKVLKIFDESSVTELNIEEEGLKLSMSKQINIQYENVRPIASVSSTQITPTQIESKPAQIQVEAPVEKGIDTNIESKEKLYEVKSPIVGTFYRAASPDSEPYVEIGSKVTAGKTLCIIEAMKLMNEIECDVAGTVEQILVQNAVAVEFGQPLFIIRLD